MWVAAVMTTVVVESAVRVVVSVIFGAVRVEVTWFVRTDMVKIVAGSTVIVDVELVTTVIVDVNV